MKNCCYNQIWNLIVPACNSLSCTFLYALRSNFRLKYLSLSILMVQVRVTSDFSIAHNTSTMESRKNWCFVDEIHFFGLQHSGKPLIAKRFYVPRHCIVMCREKVKSVSRKGRKISLQESVTTLKQEKIHLFQKEVLEGTEIWLLLHFFSFSVVKKFIQALFHSVTISKHWRKREYRRKGTRRAQAWRNEFIVL